MTAPRIPGHAVGCRGVLNDRGGCDCSEPPQPRDPVAAIHAAMEAVLRAPYRPTATHERYGNGPCLLHGRDCWLIPPWPVVDECHYPAPSLVREGHTCPQCDGSHNHDWIAWRAARQHDAGSVVGDVSGPGLAVRCIVCGGRKCDIPSCLLRRHHGGDHEHF